MKYMLISLAVASAFAGYVSARENIPQQSEVPFDKLWLHVFAKEGVHDFTAYPMKEVEKYEFINSSNASEPSEPSDSGSSEYYDTLEIRLNGSPSKKISLSDISYFTLAKDIPLIDIRLNEYPYSPELWNKELYLDATVNIDGAGDFEDVQGWETKIKGRGNTTWGMPKKPYRFKASKKISLLGMKKAKSYALIANYIDCSHMRNFLAFNLAKKLGMPFTNSCEPVRVRLNGIDKGLYFLTEKIGIGGASVDIDEEKGWLLELDTAMDEDYCYTSTPFNLPVMVKDPDLSEIYEDPDAQWEIIKEDFNSTLAALDNCTNESWRDVIDAESLINYIMVYSFAFNVEINHPKSLYIHKASPDDKYHFGPVWDFDWAYTYQSSREYGQDPTGIMFSSSNPNKGNQFFYKLTHLPGFMDEYKEKWDWMTSEILPAVLEDMDKYAERIRPAAISDGVLWVDKNLPNQVAENSFEFDLHHRKLRDWIEARVAAAGKHPNRLLFY